MKKSDMSEEAESSIETTELKKIHSSTDSAQRSGYLQWEEYFMALCFVSAQRSKDPNTQA
ncbi:putative deoxycytidylate deaminase [Mytilus galloprovincialis]|uniref:putative deoxycytidylate deaminase n=1 Tax=Mytilus galloprovincialis TaxID=29158 RepID=UPI003F7C14FC